jgi:putative isomerase
MKQYFPKLKEIAGQLGKPSWRQLLEGLADLHERSMLPASHGFPYDFEHLGPGYYYGPAFGHWDLIATIMDTVTYYPEHTRRQLLNNLHWQQPNGFLPGAIWMHNEDLSFKTDVGHPPLWPFAVEEYCKTVGDYAFAQEVLPNLVRQIHWYEANRQLPDGGMYYTDVTGDRKWESGVDDGVRYTPPPGIIPCVDASSHIYALYDFAVRWGAEEFAEKRQALGKFIQQHLFRTETGFFHDKGPNLHFTFEGFWPLTCGAATPEQANRAIDEWLLSPERFFTAHPIPAVAKCDPAFELRMWRGPSWNAMTMWCLLGCFRYGRADAVHRVSERVLDAASIQYERTGKIWEFYHPDLGSQTELTRKPYNKEPNLPCTDYIGHNPFFALARLWEQTKN